MQRVFYVRHENSQLENENIHSNKMEKLTVGEAEA